jgi:uroporphyrinogen decarboxylase
MTSRERVLAAYKRDNPDRVPAWCGASVEFWAKAKRELSMEDEELFVRFGDDFRRVYAKYTGPEFPLREGADSRTIFGIERHGIGYGQPMNHPLAEATLDDVHNYPWPDPEWMDVSSISAEAQAYGKQYAIMSGDWSPFWHDLIDLFGMENMFYKMYDAPEVVEAVLQYMVDYYFAVSQRIFDAAADDIDIFFMGNDFGGQNGALLSPDFFDRFMLPHLKRLINLGHDYGLIVQLHCCGGFAELLPAMIDAGLDGVHAIQPCCHGMELSNLKKQFGDKILFNGAIDSHHVLLKGTPKSVREDTRKVLEIMMPGSGYVAGASHDTILEETPVENVLAMFDAIKEFGVY